MSEPGTNGQGESSKEPQSLIQMLDAKCQERFERIESLIANMARSVAKRKDREHDSSEDENHDAASGRGHRAAKRAKANTNQEVDTDTDMDDQSDGEIVDDSVSAADSETNLLDELDRDLHDQEITAPPVAESLANLASNRFLSSMSVEKVKERIEPSDKLYCPRNSRGE